MKTGLRVWRSRLFSQYDFTQHRTASSKQTCVPKWEEVNGIPVLHQAYIVTQVSFVPWCVGEKQPFSLLLRGFWLTQASLCAGSLTTFSLYSSQLMSVLRYSQLQVNGLSIAMEIAMCLPIAFYGHICDRYSPAPLALLSGMLFGSGYVSAGVLYQFGSSTTMDSRSQHHYYGMVLSFLAVGAGTSAMHVAALTTCVKNFSRSQYRGFFLSAPIAAFGLSGMWVSWVGVRVFQRSSGAGSHGELDIFHFFISLGVLLFASGLLGAVGLRTNQAVGLETVRNSCSGCDIGVDAPVMEASSESEPLLAEPVPQSQSMHRKSEKRFLNKKTKAFLGDYDMWLLGFGFFLVSGVGEAYINNVSIGIANAGMTSC